MYSPLATGTLFAGTQVPYLFAPCLDCAHGMVPLKLPNRVNARNCLQLHELEARRRAAEQKHERCSTNLKARVSAPSRISPCTHISARRQNFTSPALFFDTVSLIHWHTAGGSRQRTRRAGNGAAKSELWEEPLGDHRRSLQPKGRGCSTGWITCASCQAATLQRTRTRQHL